MQSWRGSKGRSVAIGLAGLLLAMTATQALGQEYEIEGDEILIRFDEVDGTQLSEFIGMYQSMTGKVIHYTPQDIKDVLIHQIGQTRIKRARLDVFFGAVLRSLDFLLVQLGPQDAGFWSLRKITAQGGRGTNVFKALAQIVPPSELHGLADNPGVLVTTSYTTQYLPARDAVNTLQPYFADSFTDNLRNIEGTNTILMTGFANTLMGIHRLIVEIDRKPDDYYPDVVRRELKHAVADEIQPLLEELIGAYTGATQGVGGGGGRRGQAQATGAPGIEPEPSVIADIRTNSLLVTAGPETMEKILIWIEDLDIEVEPSGIHVYRLRNARATELSEVLQEIMDASQQGRRSSRGGGQQGGAPPTTGGGPGTGEQPVTIIADQQTNSLVITASKTRYAQILEIIRKLDVRPAQVLIQAALIEVSESLGEILGVELTAVNQDPDDKALFGLTNFGITELIDTDGDGFPDSRGLPTELARGMTGGVFDPEDFPLPFVLQALKNTSEANVLSLPSILTNDNQEASISAEDKAPYTTTQQGTATTESGFGGNEEAGIELTISPTISAGGYLSLSILLTVSAFTGPQTDPSVPPPSQERTIEARVTVPDGHTVVFGGVLTNDARRDEEKIPILGDLPLIGFLFRSSNDSASKTNLYFFLTPHIISDDFTILDELTRLHIEEAALLGGKVEMLNRFGFLDSSDPAMQGLSDALLERVFELPSYASVSDSLSAESPEEPDDPTFPEEQ